MHKFGEILFINSENIKRKQNSDINQGQQLLLQMCQKWCATIQYKRAKWPLIAHLSFILKPTYRYQLKLALSLVLPEAVPFLAPGA